MRNTTALVIASGFAATTAMSAPPVIHNLGVFPGGTETRGAAISQNGAFATGVGDVVTTQVNNYAFRWSIAGGLVNLGTPLGQQNSSGNVINQDGTVIAGLSDDKVFRWTFSGGMQDLGVASVLFPGLNTVTGMNANGSMIGGTCYLGGLSGTRAYRWTLGPGFAIQPSYPNNVNVESAYGNGMSNTGVIAGSYPGLQYGPFACMWLANGSLASVNGLSPWNSWATGISRNGAVIFGHNGLNSFRAFGPGFSTSVTYGPFGNGAAATNYDGQVIVGTSGGSAAIYWSTALGIHDLNAMLPGMGTNLTGWVLKQATGVSNDGSVIVGTGTYLGNTRAFVITGVVCPSVPILSPPSARSVCPHPGAGTTVALDVDAPGEVSYQWSVESPPDSGAFEKITGPFFADASGQKFRVSGWEGPELTISDLQPAAGRPNITILPHIANPCGPAIVVPIQVVLCRADLDCNEQIDDADFVEFVAGYNDLICPGGTPGLPTYCPGDLNSDAVVDDADFVIFVSAYDALLCV